MSRSRLACPLLRPGIFPRRALPPESKALPWDRSGPMPPREVPLCISLPIALDSSRRSGLTRERRSPLGVHTPDPATLERALDAGPSLPPAPESRPTAADHPPPATAPQHFQQSLLLVSVKCRPGGKGLCPLRSASIDCQFAHRVLLFLRDGFNMTSGKPFHNFVHCLPGRIGNSNQIGRAHV